MADPELEAFKSNIDLQVYAASLGYERDRRESSRCSTIMRRRADDDKIIIKLNADGHFLYFSVRDDDDNGSIIDFLQNRQRMDIGEVRKNLRPWIGKPIASSLPHFAPLEKSSRDRGLVEVQYAQTADAPRHPYLEQERCLPPCLLSNARFLGRVRIDERGNAIFPHFDQEGVCGFEKKNHGYTGFARGGEKGLWFSHVRKSDLALAICESGIEALSHAVLHPDGNTRYASIGGEMNHKQPELIKAAIAKMPAGSRIVAAFNADSEGRKFAGRLEEYVRVVGREDLGFITHEPSALKDWNEQLCRIPQTSFPTAHL